MNWDEFMKECIAAIATALASAGLGVVRLSGRNSIDIAANFFKSKKEVKSLKGYEAAYGKIYEDDFVLDDGVILVFKAPNSYTGEDVVEISCHGGLLILERLLKLCYKNGARPAKRGEFTKRAFLNSKLSLTQAEAVMDIVSADSVGFLKAAGEVKNGSLYKKAKEVTEKLVEKAGHIAVYLDYPQDEVEEVEIKKLKEEIKEQRDRLKEILKNNRFESILKNGVKVSIIGNSNVGKSTLMNLICGEEKSIVTDIEGTTRDVLKHTVEINGINFIFCDTAGIRETEDEVEKIGVKRAIEALKESDLILYIADERTKEEDLEILKGNEESKKILVYNKVDIKYDRSSFKGYKFDKILETTKEDIKTVEKLKEEIYKEQKLEGLNNKADILILNERQKQGIDRAILKLEEVLKYLDGGSYLDVIAEILDSAIESLLELTGEKVSDLVVEEIFSKFCVGK